MHERILDRERDQFYAFTTSRKDVASVVMMSEHLSQLYELSVGDESRKDWFVFQTTLFFSVPDW